MHGAGPAILQHTLLAEYLRQRLEQARRQLGLSAPTPLVAAE